MLRPYRHIYLSPHYDDAAFSCGGAIHSHVRAGERVLVVTVCASAPGREGPLSPLAAELHERMGLNPAEAVARRRAEDEAALARLGADAWLLEVRDCIYRGQPRNQRWYYTTLEAVFGEVHPEESMLPASIAGAVSKLAEPAPDTILYAPLGAGGHVDHQHAHRAAVLLAEKGWRVAFYEDVPYADDRYPHPLAGGGGPALEDRVASSPSGPLEPRLVYLKPEDWQARLDGARAYRSQLALMFGSVEAVVPRLEAFAGRYEEGCWCERIWIPVKDLCSPRG